MNHRQCKQCGTTHDVYPYQKENDCRVAWLCDCCVHTDIYKDYAYIRDYGLKGVYNG